MKKIFLAIIFALLISGCAPPTGDSPDASDTKDTEVVGLTDSVFRVVDEEAGVVCWIYSSGGYKGGIDCMRIEETDLDR